MNIKNIVLIKILIIMFSLLVNNKILTKLITFVNVIYIMIIVINNSRNIK